MIFQHGPGQKFGYNDLMSTLKNDSPYIEVDFVYLGKLDCPLKVTDNARVPVMWETKQKRNTAKRNETQRNETKHDETKQNMYTEKRSEADYVNWGTKRNETKRIRVRLNYMFEYI